MLLDLMSHSCANANIDTILFLLAYLSHALFIDIKRTYQFSSAKLCLNELLLAKKLYKANCVETFSSILLH